jgi:Fe-S cluster assembly protein SufD
MTQLTQETDKQAISKYLDKFKRFEDQGAGRQPSWLYPIRKAGLARFAELGFPTTVHEDYRFTNVAPIAELPFDPVFEAPESRLTAKDLERLAFADLKSSRLVFVDGHFSKELSSILPQKGGVKISSLASALVTDSLFLESHLGQHAPVEHHPFAALNNAFFLDGAFIQVPAGQEVREPIQLLYISTTAEAGATVQPRNLIIADANSRVTVIESHVAMVDGAYFTNVVTELVVGENANVELVKFQDESTEAFHIATLHAHLERSSNVSYHSIATGAKLSRNNIRTNLAGEGIECVLNGLYLTKDAQLADHHMIVEHAQPNCNSHEYFNGILDDQSRGVFHGRIYVHPVAQKTDAKQTNKNLLLSDEATANTKPQLEIYADDVKCTHGATIGQLDEESIFYCQARGIDKDTARRMLIHAFAGEIIERIRCEPVRGELDRIVWDRLEQHPLIAEKR